MPKQQMQSWLLLVSLALVWGSSFILMKKGLEVFGSNQVAALRISIATLSLLPFVVWSFKKVQRKDYGILFLVALFGSGMPPFLFTHAQTEISSALAGLLNTLTPLFTFLLGVVIWKLMFSWRKLGGILLGLVGAVGLMLFSQPPEGGGNNWYGLFVVLATASYALNANLIKQYCQDIPPIAISTIGFVFTGPIAMTYLLSTDFLTILQSDAGAWWALFLIALLAVFGTAIANIFYFRLTQLTDALFASTVTYLIPIIAILWGIWDGEAIDWTYFVGMLLILGGVYLASRR
ncbi:MAG: DMT family transporter [Bacteroidota bacterium]